MLIDTNLIKKRLSKTHKVGKILMLLPFIRCVILNGSLASGNHKKSSDIDILIIAKTGRIFSARFFVNFFTTIFRIKRSKDEAKDHSGKFCFNYFLTEDFLKIPTGRGEEMDRYCADNYSQSQFIAGDIKLFQKFIRANKKLFNTYDCHPEFISGSQNKHGVTIIRSIFEFILTLWFEEKVKKYQIKKIESDPRTKEYPNLIVYSDKELRFHPPTKAAKDRF